MTRTASGPISLDNAPVTGTGLRRDQPGLAAVTRNARGPISLDSAPVTGAGPRRDQPSPAAVTGTGRGLDPGAALARREAAVPLRLPPAGCRTSRSRDLAVAAGCAFGGCRAAVISLCLLALSACGRYSEFTLPPQPGSDAPPVFRFVAEPAPVLTNESFRDVLNPSVAGRFNLYSVYDGQAWHTALATTDDGTLWQPQGIVLRAAPGEYIAANGSALSHGGQLWYWYETGTKEHLRISLARSQDGKSWTREPAPVLDLGPSGSWDERAVADPYVIRIEPYFYMYYLGQDRAVRQRLGVARSQDGIHWEKLRSNPVLELESDEAGLGEPAVWQSHGFYWMLYTVREFNEHRHLRLARSTDGVRWTRLPGIYRGEQEWNSKVICDPTVVVDGDRIRVWFGGGDVASPDENLHGQIGFATLTK